MPTTRNMDLDSLEGIIDGMESFNDFIDLLAEVYSAKADRLDSIDLNWQDRREAEIWNRRAAYLLYTSEAVAKSFVEHPLQSYDNDEDYS